MPRSTSRKPQLGLVTPPPTKKRRRRPKPPAFAKWSPSYPNKLYIAEDGSLSGGYVDGVMFLVWDRNLDEVMDSIERRGRIVRERWEREQLERERSKPRLVSSNPVWRVMLNRAGDH